MNKGDGEFSMTSRKAYFSLCRYDLDFTRYDVWEHLRAKSGQFQNSNLGDLAH